jgi:hypothetical protein
MNHTAKQRSNLLFTGAVTRLEGNGYKLIPQDYVDLHRLAHAAVEPAACSVSLFAVPPLCVGRVIIQVPTVGAWMWWERCGKVWYDDDTLGVIAFAYICHYSRDESKISPLYDRSEADKALFSFRCMIGCSATTIELKAGLDRMERNLDALFDEGAEQVEGDDAPISANLHGDIIARLCSAYHNLSPHKVAFELSPDECIGLLKVAPSPFGMRAPEDTSEFDALARFQNFVRKLEKERKPCSA